MEGHCRGLEIIITMTAPIFIVAKRLPQLQRLSALLLTGRAAPREE